MVPGGSNLGWQCGFTCSEECVFQCLDKGQLAEVQKLLGSDLQMCQRAGLSDVQQGWQVAECSSKAVSCVLDLQSCLLKHGRAWVKFLDAESETVRPSRQESEVAEFFARAVRLQSPVHLAVRPEDLGLRPLMLLLPAALPGLAGDASRSVFNHLVLNLTGCPFFAQLVCGRRCRS